MIPILDELENGMGKYKIIEKQHDFRNLRFAVSAAGCVTACRIEFHSLHDGSCMGLHNDHYVTSATASHRHRLNLSKERDQKSTPSMPSAHEETSGVSSLTRCRDRRAKAPPIQERPR